MRCFASLASLLLAQTSLAAQKPSPTTDSVEIIPTAYVTLKVPVEDDGSQVLSVRLDLHQSNQACGVASLNINGLPLSQNATGGGQGAFTLNDGVIIGASWKFTCVKNEQHLAMTIHSVNGRSVSNKVFSTTFRQVTPVRILDVRGAAKVKLVHQLTSHEEHIVGGESEIDSESNIDTTQDDKFDFNLDNQISALEELRRQAQHLKQLIRAKEAEIMEHLVYKDETEHPMPKRPIKECNDLGCIFHGLAWKIKHTHGDICSGSPQWWHILGCEQQEQKKIDKHDDVIIANANSQTQLQAMTKGSTTYPEKQTDRYEESQDEESYYKRTSARMPLLILITEVALIFGCVFLSIIYMLKLYFNSCRQRIVLEENNSLDAIRSRRRLVFNDFFRGLFQNDEKWEDVPDSEKEERLPRWAENSHTSVAEELSGLREAASMVSDIINRTSRPSNRPRGDTPPPAYNRATEDSRPPRYSDHN